MDTLNIILIIFLIAISFIVGWYSTSGSKTQWIRLCDIFLFGPFLIFVGIIQKNIIIRALLIIIGSSTMAYNLRNYITEL